MSKKSPYTSIWEKRAKKGVSTLLVSDQLREMQRFVWVKETKGKPLDVQEVSFEISMN